MKNIKTILSAILFTCAVCLIVGLSTPISSKASDTSEPSTTETTEPEHPLHPQNNAPDNNKKK